MRTLLILITLLQTSLGICQQKPSTNKIELSLTDLYVVDIVILNELEKGFCDCSVGQKSKKNKCILYEVKINELVFQADSTVFSEQDILNITKLLVPENWEEDIKPGDNKLMVLSNTSSREYLKIKSIIYPVKGTDFSFVSNMQLNSLIECKKVHPTFIKK